MYIPDADYTHFAFTLNDKYKTKSTFEGCDFTANHCRFNVSCDTVRNDPDVQGIPFSIELDDGIDKFNLTTLEHGMLVDGSSFGASDNFCYIPVFRSSLAAADQWYVGSIFMSQYVVVYDNTPNQLNGYNYAQVGFGKVNPNGIQTGIQQQYNSSAPGYNKQPHDSSHNITYPTPGPAPAPPGPTPDPPTPNPKPNPTPPGPDEGKDSLFIYLGICGALLVLCLIVSCCVANKKKKKNTFRMFSEGDMGGLKQRI
jgi:hypothetical protein